MKFPGKTKKKGDPTCPVCKGLGFVAPAVFDNRVGAPIPTVSSDLRAIACPNCSGTGKVPEGAGNNTLIRNQIHC
jgi:RecJ-like exonuclease